MADDVFAAADSIARRRKLLDVLAQSSQQAPIEGGGNYGIGQALAKLATAYVTGQKQQGLDQSAAANRAQYGTELSQGLDKYLTTHGGQTGAMSDQQAGDLMNSDINPTLQPQIKADPRRAIVEAMGSRFPELQGIGKTEFANYTKAKTGGDFKDHLTQDGTLVRAYGDGRVQQLGTYAKPKDQFTEPYLMEGASGKILVKKNLATQEVEPVDKGIHISTTNNLDMVGNKEALKDTREVLKGARDDFIFGQKMVQQAQRIEALASDPQTITGAGANPLAFLAAVGAKLGISGPEAPAKTQVLISDLARSALDAGQKMKGSFSDADILFLKSIEGAASLTPEAIQHIASLAQQTAFNLMVTSREQHQSASTVKGAEEIVKLQPLPAWGSVKLGKQFAPEEGGAGRVRYSSPLIAPLQKQQAPAGVKKPIVTNW